MPQEDASPITILRPDDLLLLRFHFHGLKLQSPQSSDQSWTLIKDPPNQPKPLIIVEFPPQSIGEQAFFEETGISPPTGEPPPPPPGQPPPPPDSGQTPKPPGQVGAFLSGPTWLVFNVANQNAIPYTLAGLLGACVSGNQVVSTQAKKPIDRLIRLDFNLAHGLLFSRIEAPYRLVLSPDINTTWWGRVLPKPNTAGHAGRAVARGDDQEPPDANQQAAAARRQAASRVGDRLQRVAARQPAKPRERALRMSLDSRDRYELVRLTTDAGNYAKPIEADQLILSTMGAWLKAAGAWTNLPSDLSVTEWKHLMTMGRDHFVRVVYQGYLFPFGHAASLVKITERKIENVTGQSTARGLSTHAHVRDRAPADPRLHQGRYAHVQRLPFHPGDSQDAGHAQH